MRKEKETAGVCQLVQKADFQRLFQSSPGLSLVLNPDLEIVDATDQYLEATHTVRDRIVGRHLFEVFPDNPEDPKATGVRNLRASLERVLRTGKPDTMVVQKYDVRRPGLGRDGFEERYWLPLNTPVFGDDGEIAYIIHRVEDATEFIHLLQRQDEKSEVAASLRKRADRMEAEIYRRAQAAQETNRQLEAAKDRFENLLSSINDGFISIDQQWRVTYANEREAELLGIGKEELLGRDFRDALDQPDDQPILDSLLKAMDEGVQVNFEHFHPRTGRWFEKRVYPAAEGITCLATDVTEQKEADLRVAVEHTVTRVLAESASLEKAGSKILAAICDLLHGAVAVLWLVDPKEDALKCVGLHRCIANEDTAAFERETRGRTFSRGSSLPGRVWVGLKPTWIENLADDPHFPRALSAFADDLRGAVAFPILAGGEFFGVIEFFLTHSFEPGQPVLRMMASIGSEIGQFIQRRRAEAAHVQLAAIVESSSDAILSLTPEGRVLTWNVGAEKLFRYSAREMIGTRVSRLLHEQEAKNLEEAFTCALNGEAILNFEATFVRKDGRPIYMSLALSPIQNSYGNVTAVSLIARDLTQQKEREETARRNRELEEENVRVLQASRMKTDFLASMSHELRAPLNGIIGFGEFLADEKAGPLNAKQREFLNDILKSGRHLLQLINNILDLAKVEVGRMELWPEAFSPKEGIEEVCSTMKPLMIERDLRFTMDVAHAPASVFLDRIKFKQILYNLLSNAVKFNHDRGTVTVVASGSVESNLLTLSIADTGIGIFPEEIPDLFVEFQQLKGNTHPREGTGLGLAVTKKLVELMGGTIEVESSPGKGSTFTVTLPAKLEETRNDHAANTGDLV